MPCDFRPYYIVYASVKLNSVKPGSVGSHGFPSDMDPWNLTNAVLERAADSESWGAGTGFGCRDMDWGFYADEELPEERARALHDRVVKAIDTMGWEATVTLAHHHDKVKDPKDILKTSIPAVH